MKIYHVHLAEEGMTAGYSKNNKVSILRYMDPYKKYIQNDECIENWDTIYVDTNNVVNERAKKCNIMRFSTIYIADEYSKNLLNDAFGEYIQFLTVVNDDDLSNNYFWMYPVLSLECVDLDKSECRYMDEEKQWVSTVYKYVLKNNLTYYPIFKMKHNDRVDACRVYVTDEFKNYVEDNGITGFGFEEIFDFENTPSDKYESADVNQLEENTDKIVRESEIYKIPMEYTSGKYILNELGDSQGECFTVEYDGYGILSNNINNYMIYDLCVNDMTKDMEVVYQNGRLYSVYVNSEKGKMPVYLSFDFSKSNEPSELIQAVQNSSGFCACELMNTIKNTGIPLKSLSLECYYDGQEMYVNLRDNSGEIYEISEAAVNTIKCLCIFAEDSYNRTIGRCTETDMSFEIFSRIVKSIHKILVKEIPERFFVCKDFVIYEPDMNAL